MKLLTSALALSLVLGASLDASAQYSRKDYPSSRTTTEPTASTTTAPSRNSPRTRTETQATPAPAEVSAREIPRSTTSTTTSPSRTSPRTSTRTTTRTTTSPTRPTRYETQPTTVYRRTTVDRRPQRPVAYQRVIYYGGLDRGERRNLQARLERRAEEVGQWDYELDAWEADIYGRDYRRQDRYDPYYGYNTQRLLSERELCDWSDRLDDATRILINREQRLADADERRYRNPRSNNRSRGRSNGNQNNNANTGGTCPPSWN